MTQRATTSLSLHYRVKAGQKEEALWRSLRKVSAPLSRSSHTSDTQGPPTASDSPSSVVSGRNRNDAEFFLVSSLCCFARPGTWL
jgi:hypothetical protein